MGDNVLVLVAFLDDRPYVACAFIDLEVAKWWASQFDFDDHIEIRGARIPLIALATILS